MKGDSGITSKPIHNRYLAWNCNRQDGSVDLRDMDKQEDYMKKEKIVLCMGMLVMGCAAASAVAVDVEGDC